MSQIERDQLLARYWGYCCGTPIPGFVQVLLGAQLVERLHDRYCARRWGRRWGNLPLALELAHRREPIETLQQLRRARAIAQADGYDWGPAAALAEEIGKEEAALNRERERAHQKWRAGLPAARAAATPSGRQLARELAAKQLPADPAANLVLMRAALKMPARAES